MELIQESDRSKWMVHSNHSIRCFTKGDIEIMTNNYRTSLGRGAFGEVYEGLLEDDSMVAVKRLIGNVKENFAKEFIVHREINHKNVVRLIGYCVEENALMLVMEYIANGNLSDVLHNDNRPIPLDIRLRIAIECAEALAYLHSHMYTQVIHMDIKPGNILLDSNFHAKLSDFGISRLVNTDKTLYTENVIGSIGYMDPLFARDGLLTSKSDVYSFGVVLLELITRKKATTEFDNVNIVYAFTNALVKGIRGVREMLDAEIASKNNMNLLEGVAKLAGECLRTERDKRPEMIDVAERLRVLQKTSHQDQGRQRVDLFYWVRKSNSAPPTAVTVPARILSSDRCHHFSFAEIKAATNNFDESLVIDHGGSGRVYRGQIDGRTTNVAIKRYYHPQFLNNKKFNTEIKTMLKRRHHHLVPLIGYCADEDKMIMVYEYMARGSLHDHLLCGTQKPPLTWKQRIETCIGAARGLRYLHGQQIIHRKVNTKKILLGEEWVAKITDLSCSKTGPSTDATLVFGTIGYLDPEYLATSRITEKSDVYSFGAVLLEALCARPAFDKYLPTEQNSLASWALRCKEEGNLDHIIDPYLRGTINPCSLDKFAETALKCVAPKGIDRPSMGGVISDLEHALQLQESADASEGAKILQSRLCRQFSLAEMKAATNNFDKSLLIDNGGLFGRVYIGKIDGAAITLVEFMYSVSAFHSLIEIMSKLGHVHLVPLIGYCHEQEMTLLVYEYVAGGNLCEHLYRTRKPPLNWTQRMEICIGVARGLFYLHGLKLIHGAVRTSNILLDEECLAKITNLAPPSNFLDTHATEFCETDGYSDPEYLRTGLRTEKSDVYCFGLVLLEVLFGRPVIKCQRLEEQVAWLVSWALQWPTLTYLDLNVDPFLRGKINPQSLYKFFQTAVKCLADKGTDRPSMGDVLWNLKYALELNEERLERFEDGGSMSDDGMDEGR